MISRRSFIKSGASLLGVGFIAPRVLLKADKKTSAEVHQTENSKARWPVFKGTTIDQTFIEQFKREVKRAYLQKPVSNLHALTRR